MIPIVSLVKAQFRIYQSFLFAFMNPRPFCLKNTHVIDRPNWSPPRLGLAARLSYLILGVRTALVATRRPQSIEVLSKDSNTRLAIRDRVRVFEECISTIIEMTGVSVPLMDNEKTICGLYDQRGNLAIESNQRHQQ